MNSVLNLSTTQTAENFLNYIKHSFYGTITDWYDSSEEKCKNVLIIMETTATMCKTLYKEIETKFIETKLDSEENARLRKTNINNRNLWA